MHVSALVVGILALTGLVAAMVQLSAHHNGPVLRHSAPPTIARPPEPAWLAEIVLDPLTERELALGQLDHGAESFAAHADMFDEYHARHREETARQFWNDGFDWYINHLNAQFDALLEGLPTTEEDAFPAGYWPVVSAVPTSGLPGIPGEPLTLEVLGNFSPEATIAMITQQNAQPTCFSWSTQEQPLVRGHGSVQVAQQGDGVILVRERPNGVARHRRGRHS